FHHPLIPVAVPEDQVTPPLVRGFMGDDPFTDGGFNRSHAQGGSLGGSEKGKAGEENQSRPTLAQDARHLGKGQLAVRVGAKALIEKLDRLGGAVGYLLRVSGRRRGQDRDIEGWPRDPAMPG